jgi:hypothetical protein
MKMYKVAGIAERRDIPYEFGVSKEKLIRARQVKERLLTLLSSVKCL